jgi:hypothetical protein
MKTLFNVVAAAVRVYTAAVSATVEQLRKEGVIIARASWLRSCPPPSRPSRRSTMRRARTCPPGWGRSKERRSSSPPSSTSSGSRRSRDGGC